MRPAAVLVRQAVPDADPAAGRGSQRRQGVWILLSRSAKKRCGRPLLSWLLLLAEPEFFPDASQFGGLFQIHSGNEVVKRWF